MTTTLTWGEIVLRLALTFVAGAIVGINRGEHSRPAGLRTTLLLCLAASVAMIQANLLMDSTGKASDSFVVLDLMRLPLGILTGVGFIGAGAILRRDSMVVGVTTAATLWFVTVMGLCFGGGQIGLGLISLALCLLTLWGLKFIEKYLKHEHFGTLVVAVELNGPGEEEISRPVKEANYWITSWSISYNNEAASREYRCMLRWQDHHPSAAPPAFLKSMAQLSGVTRLSWRPALGP